MRRRLEPIMSSGELSESYESGHLWHSKRARHMGSAMQLAHAFW